MPTRTPPSALLLDELMATLTSAGLRPDEVEPAEAGADKVRVAGRWWHPVGLVHPSVGEVLVHAEPGVVVVADRLSAAVREAVERKGAAWVDRRGELRFPGRSSELLSFEATVPAPERVMELFTATGLDVVVTMLGAVDQAWGVRELARAAGRSPGRVSELLGALRAEGLVDRAGRPLVPELFWEAAGAWRPRWRPIPMLPVAGVGAVVGGWNGALAWDAPVLVTGDAPVELYVTDRSSLDRLVAGVRADDATGDGRGHVAAVCPAPLVVHRSGEGQPRVAGFPVASLVAVAFDLAQDRGRGREILEGWTPAGGGRVW